jgi:extracellular factor (EF) 3-hydroxypalmitic acid methyl ester biosynthesis protein
MTEDEISPTTAEYPQQDMERLLTITRAAAKQLVAELAEARCITREWADAKLTDALVDAALSGCLNQLAETRCWGQANQLPSTELWRIAGPLLKMGMLQCHARLKPRGYAGDYQMLHWIYTGYCCDHPLGGAFDRYFQRQAAPQAVRFRTEQTAAAMVAHCLQTDTVSYHILSVGAGPADDICQALALLPEVHRGRLRVTLLDLDPEALEFALQRVQAFLPSNTIRDVRENLFRLPRRARPEEVLRTPHFLVCLGLFDYLDDETAKEMLHLFWQQLDDRGMLVVGNFAPNNPTRAYMEWIGNWYLNYRTAEELRRLGLQAGIPEDQVSIGSDPLGADLILIAQNPARQVNRVDGS